MTHEEALEAYRKANRLWQAAEQAMLLAKEIDPLTAMSFQPGLDVAKVGLAKAMKAVEKVAFKEAK